MLIVKLVCEDKEYVYDIEKKLEESDEFDVIYKGIEIKTQKEVIFKVKENVNDDVYSEYMVKIKNLEYIKKQTIAEEKELFAEYLGYTYNKGTQTMTLIFDYCNIGSLQNYINKNKALEEKVAHSLLIQFTIGVMILNIIGISHRTLKPSKLYLHRNEKSDKILIKISNFNCEKLDVCLKTTIKPRDKLIKLWKTIEKDSLYEAPQIINNESYTIKSEILSLGMIYYVMLFEKFPWNMKNPKNIDEYLEIISRKDLITFPQHVNPVSDESKQFILECLKYEENERINWENLFNCRIFQRQYKSNSNLNIGNLSSTIPFRHNPQALQINNDDLLARTQLTKYTFEESFNNLYELNFGKSIKESRKKYFKLHQKSKREKQIAELMKNDNNNVPQNRDNTNQKENNKNQKEINITQNENNVTTKDRNMIQNDHQNNKVLNKNPYKCKITEIVEENDNIPRIENSNKIMLKDPHEHNEVKHRHTMKCKITEINKEDDNIVRIGNNNKGILNDLHENNKILHTMKCKITEISKEDDNIVRIGNNNKVILNDLHENNKIRNQHTIKCKTTEISKKDDNIVRIGNNNKMILKNTREDYKVQNKQTNSYNTAAMSREHHNVSEEARYSNPQSTKKYSHNNIIDDSVICLVIFLVIVALIVLVFVH